MRIKLHLQFFTKELVLFGATLAAGMFMAYQYSIQGLAPDPIEPISFSWVNVAAMVAFFLVFTFVLTRYRRVADSSFRIFLMLVIFSGAELFSGTFVEFPYDTIIGVLALGAVLAVRNVLAHNIGVGLGIAGIAALLGLSITPMTGVFILAALSLYDIVAVYKTRHMVTLARGMIQSGAIFGFLIPFHWKDFLLRKEHAEPGEHFMILGSGDIGLPIMLVASVVPNSLPRALVLAPFVLLGLFATHLIFVNQTRRAPMAALPPIATVSIVGYLISLLIV